MNEMKTKQIGGVDILVGSPNRFDKSSQRPNFWMKFGKGL